MAKKAKWTYMVYLAGDNNLASAGDVDLKEMRAVGSTEDVNIVAQFDSTGSRGTVRYHLRRDGKDEKPESLGLMDSGDPQTLIDFVDWTAKNFEAERYGLILWNHGGGWEPSEMDHIARSVNAEDYTPREMTERSSTPLRRTLFRTTLEKIFSQSTMEERAIASDDASGHSLDTIELGNVLSQAVQSLGKPLEILGMDACLMSNLEVAYQVRPYAKYMVASEENEPNNGWPYDVVLRRLVDDPDLATDQLAAHIVESYIQSYIDSNHAGPVTQAAYDLSKIEQLVEPVNTLADAMAAHMPDAAQEIWRAQRNSARFWHNTLWDISHFCQELEKGTSDNSVREAARSVRDALQKGAGRFIVAERHNGDKVKDCGGSTFYLLPPIQDLSRYYDDLDYAKEQRWLQFLRAYHAS